MRRLWSGPELHAVSARKPHVAGWAPMRPPHRAGGSALLAMASATLLASAASGLACDAGPSCESYAKTRARCPREPGPAPNAALYRAVCRASAAVNPAVAREVACAGHGQRPCDTFWRCVHEGQERQRAAEVSHAAARQRWDDMRLACEDPVAPPSPNGELAAACAAAYGALAQAHEEELRATRDAIFPAGPTSTEASKTNPGVPHKLPREDELKARCAAEAALAARLTPAQGDRLSGLCQQALDALAARRAVDDAETNLAGHKRYVPASCRRASARLRAGDAPDADGWRAQALQRVTATCYVSLGEAILSAEQAKPRGSGGTCGHATREILRAVDDFGLRSPALDRAAARVRARCTAPKTKAGRRPGDKRGPSPRKTRPPRLSRPKPPGARARRGTARSGPTRPSRGASPPR